MDMNLIQGTNNDDSLSGGTEGASILVGKSGDDAMVAGSSGGVMIGDGHGSGSVNPSNIKISESVTAHVSFDGSQAGYKNTVGMYTYDAAGNITSVKVLYTNVSWEGAEVGSGSADIALKAGERVGFFVAPNAYNHNTDILTLADGKFALVDATTGGAANVNAGHEMQLAFVGADGSQTVLHTQFGTSIFTTNTATNGDSYEHAHVQVSSAGSLSIQFEDLWNGGDQNFGDANFSLDIGEVNVALMPRGTEPTKAGTYNDTMTGGDGNDTIYGMAGDDTMSGGLGDNVMNGGSGNDTFVAAGGNDDITGGKGFDTLDYSQATQGVRVDLEAHAAEGFGSGSVAGVEALVGSAFDDSLTGDKADNLLEGGAGNDLLRGGRGNDTLVGGEGSDTFQFLKKDVLDKTGAAMGVDHVQDFGAGDILDLTDLLKSVKGEHAKLLSRVDTDAGTEVYAKIGGDFHAVAVLDNVHGMTVGDMMQAGMLLA